MFKMYYPYEYVDGVFSIDYVKLYKKGYRGIIFDIDNTLVPHGKDSTEKIDELFKNIHDLGFKTLLLSNNSEERIKRFNKNIQTLYIHEANKPKVDNFFKAVKMLDVRKENVVVIGDQVFYDIYGANKSGLACVLVKYLRYKNETKIGIKRNIEKVILKMYCKSKKYTNRIGDIHKKGGSFEYVVE